MDRAFWKNTRAFVTGHTGFKGGWLCAWLLDAGADVSGYALAPAQGEALASDPAIARELRATIADIRDDAALLRAIAAARPDIVFHLAAQPLVRASYEQPVETFDVNVAGTAAVLAAASAVVPEACVVVVTSDKCYAPVDRPHRFTETDALGGDDPYSASKACAEHVVAGLRPAMLAGGAGIATARAGNVIGGGDAARDRLLPDLLRAFDAGATAGIRRPSDIRPWQHVLDPLDGYLRLGRALLGERRAFSSAWNFGPPAGHEITVGALADLACGIWGSGARWQASGGVHPPENPALRLDSAKAAERLRWRPRVPLRDAVGWTIDWYRERSAGTPAVELMRRDIARYESIAA